VVQVPRLGVGITGRNHDAAIATLSSAPHTAS
jgi:hypothetical protein